MKRWNRHSEVNKTMKEKIDDRLDCVNQETVANICNDRQLLYLSVQIDKN